MRALTYAEQKTMNNDIMTLGEREANKVGKHFSKAGVMAVFEHGTSYTQRVKATIPELAKRFFENFDGDLAQFFVDEPETVNDAPTVEQTTDAITPFVGMMQDMIMAEVEARLAKFEPKIDELNVTINNGDVHRVKGIRHKEFETVLSFVANDEPVYLYGRAGTGKNVLAQQIAEAMGLEFYYANAVTQEHVLTGFVDAMGNYHATQFYEAFTKGGVFMLDEMDASSAEVLIILNGAIANRYFPFPNGEKAQAHPDFRVIAAGNTVGTGATYEYNGRSQLDAASLDRFAMVEIDYDVRVERELSRNPDGNVDEDLVQFVHELRKQSEAIGRAVTVTYRGIQRMAKMCNALGVKKCLMTCIIKGMDKSDVRAIADRMTKGGVYLDAIKAM